jgi:hypothetical protein
MHDNARPHIAQIVNEYLDTVEYVWTWSEDELKSELLLLQT